MSKSSSKFPADFNKFSWMSNKAKISKFDWSLRAPLDERDSKYIRSFEVSDSRDKILSFYNKFGFVVFNNVLNVDEIEESIRGLWEAYPDASMDDPLTWDLVNHSVGFAGRQPLDGKRVWNIRQHQNVYDSFKLLYELTSGKPLTEPLVSCFDRGSIMRPIRGPHGKPEWVTNRLHHFDINPYVWCNMQEPDPSFKSIKYCSYGMLLSEGNNTRNHGYPKLRAVLQLSDSTEEAGGFECSVGFNRIIKKWCKATPPREFMNPYGWGVDASSDMARNMQKITCRAGSLIVFSAELPHTMFPNESEKFRYALYLRMTPLSTLELSEELLAARKRLIQEHLPRDLAVTEIGKEVFLLD